VIKKGFKQRTEENTMFAAEFLFILLEVLRSESIRLWVEFLFYRINWTLKKICPMLKTAMAIPPLGQEATKNWSHNIL